MNQYNLNFAELNEGEIGASKKYAIKIVTSSPYLDQYEIPKPIAGSVKLIKLTNSIIGHFQLQTTLKLVCCRCAENYSFLLKLNYQQEFKNKDKYKPDKDETTYTISEDTVNVLPSILQEINLAIPIKPLCRSDCLGLCQICGKNLNHKPHHHPEDNQINPFSILKNKFNK